VDHLVTHAFKNANAVAQAIAVRRHANGGGDRIVSAGAAHYLFADGGARAWSWSDFALRFSPSTSPFDPETAR
ncbi:MAG: hypothetical protein ACK58T_27920, partial [Phycisphaerae bacterium]